MAEDDGKEKFEFNAEGEGLGYISLDQAQVLAMRTAREAPGAYGQGLADAPMAFEVLVSNETEDHYIITLSFRPQGTFTGKPGREQFFVSKEGRVEHRQVLDLPRSSRRFPTGGIAALAVAVAGVGVVWIVLGMGGNGGGADGGNLDDPPAPAAALPAETPQAPPAAISPTVTNPPTPTLAPTMIPRASVATTVPTSVPRFAPTRVPLPTATIPRPTPTAAPANQKVVSGRYGGNIRMSAYADVRDWDPLGSASLSSVQAYSQLYNQLVQFDTINASNITGDLATSWTVTNGGNTFTFHLAEDAQWHDGEKVTADDVVFSMVRYMENPKIGRSGLFRNYTKSVADGGVKKIDDYTVEMNLTFPSGAFINFLALDYVKVLPKHLLERGIDLNQADNIIFNRSGSGPFVLDEYQRGNLYRVSRNPNYFKEGPPFFDSIDHFIITDPGTLIAQFKARQLDMMNGGFSNLTPTGYLQLDKDTVGSSNGHIIANELPRSRNWGLMINRKAGPFTDPRVRKAIYLALDRRQLNDLIEDGTADPACALMGLGYSFQECSRFPGIREKSSPGGQADLEFAMRLMADAGFPNGFKTQYDVRAVGTYPDTCSVVKQQLKDTLGIDGNINVHESAAGYALYATARPEGALGDWELACQGEGMTVIDPDALLGSVYLKGAILNYTDWEPANVRAAFEAQKVEQDPAKRKQMMKDLEDFLIPTDPNDISKGFTDNHWVTLFWGKFFWLVHEDIRGFNAPQTVQYGFKHEDLWLDR